MNANSINWTQLSERCLIQAAQRVAAAVRKLGLVTRDEGLCFQGNGHKGMSN